MPLDPALITFLERSRARLVAFDVDDGGTGLVGPTLTWRPPGLATGAEPERIGLGELLRFERVALIGDAGSGTSTCLRRIALTRLDEIERAADGSDLPLPIYVRLVEWTDRTMDAREFLRARAVELLGPTADVDALMADGRLLVLLDGLDELPGRRAHPGGDRYADDSPDGESRAYTHGDMHMDPRELALREFAAGPAARSRFVLSCRSHEFADSGAWQRVRLEPLDAAQVAYLATRWGGDVTARGLDAALHEDEGLAGIASNPFYLRCLVAAMRAGTWRAGPPASRADVLRAFVGPVAFAMLCQGDYSLLPPVPDRDAVRRAVESGLLVERAGAVSFSHPIIQEYLAAAALSAGVIRARLTRLLADKRFSDVLVLWYDLDPDAMFPRLVRGLHARNLPWRRPRSAGSQSLEMYVVVTTTVAVALAAGWLVDRFGWSFPTLGSPVPLPLWVAVIAVALAVIPVWKSVIFHQPIAGNSASVLARGRYRPEAVTAVIQMLRWVSVRNERPGHARWLVQFGPAATGAVVLGLGSRRWLVWLGCVEALGEVLRRNAHDRLATEALLALTNLDDLRLVRPVATALTWSSDPRVPEALTRILEAANARDPAGYMYLLEPSIFGQRGRLSAETGGIEPRLAALVRGPAKPERASIRAEVARLCGVLRVADAELARLAGDRQEQMTVRHAAVAALADLRTPDAAQVLAALARDESKDIRAGVLDRLPRTGPDLAGPVLLGLALDPSYPQRRTALRRLWPYRRDDVDDALRRLVSDPDRGVRRLASTMLAPRQDRASTPARGPSGWRGLVEVWRSARATGLGAPDLIPKMVTSYLDDAELRVRHRRRVNLLSAAVAVALYLALASATVLATLAPVVALIALRHWYVVLPAAGVILATLLPWVRPLDGVPGLGHLIRTLRALLGALAVAGLVGAAVYAWWIVLALAVGIAVVAVLVRRNGRGRSLRAAAALARETQAATESETLATVDRAE
jgi:NACHT domain